MAGKVDVGRLRAAAILRAMGYSVAEIAERPTPTCDLKAVLPPETLWIEVKTSEPSEDEQMRLARQETVTMTKLVGRSTTMHGVLRKAAHQIRSTALPDEPGLRLVWLRIVGAGDLSRSMLWFSTLFGVRWFHIKEPPLSPNVVPCFLADRSGFRSCPEICGVVTEVAGRCGLLINPFSAAVDELIATRLCRVLSAARAVFGFRASDLHNGLYIADPAAAPAGEEAVIRSLKDRYGMTVRPTPVEAYSTAWPGHETGGMPGMPGHDSRIAVWELMDYLHRSSQGGGSSPA